MRRVGAACLAALSAFSAGGCAGGGDLLAVRLADTARASALPKVVACWEKEVEGAHFKGGYAASVDFTIEARTSRIKGARVTSLTSDPPRDSATFGACIEAGLDASALPTYATAEGPGFQVDSDLRVKGLRLIFTGPSSKDRDAASARNPNVLVGPRADRCQGLYTHEPPRDASILYGEISAGEARASYLKVGDRDEYARQLQKLFDLELELRDRLRADLAAPGLPEANLVRTKKALGDDEASARRTGALIGCGAPARPR